MLTEMWFSTTELRIIGAARQTLLVLINKSGITGCVHYSVSNNDLIVYCSQQGTVT